MFRRNYSSLKKHDHEIFGGCILLLILVISIFPKVSVKNVSGSTPVPSLVHVLEDNDPDFQNPPFEDRLTIINPVDHTRVRTVSEFNIAGSAGARRFLAATDSGLACLIVNEASHQLVKYNFITNETSIMTPCDMHSVYISENGDIYALTDGTIYEKTIVKIDQSGNIIKEARYGGVNLAVDDDHDSIWIVGANITRLNRDFKKQFSIDPIAWATFSVDFTSDGSAWISESKHSDVAESKTRLLKISTFLLLARCATLGWPGCLNKL
ncbi:MAG: hypothetical protein QXF52_07260 [Thermoproteota archaeon]